VRVRTNEVAPDGRMLKHPPIGRHFIRAYSHGSLPSVFVWILILTTLDTSASAQSRQVMSDVASIVD
jgi:hypothetical protein